MDIIVTGVITQALPVQQGVSQKTGNQWQRASYIIEHEHGQYPRRMVFDVSNGRIQELALQLGETVTLHLNVDCREYPQGSGRYFNSIEAWKVERVQQAPQPQYQQAPAPAPEPQAPPQPQYQNAPQQGGLPFPPSR